MEIAYAQPEIAQAVLDLAAFIAARNRDTELADAVAVLAIERLVVAQSIERLLPTFAVLVQCAAAVSDRKEAQATLARRFWRIWRSLQALSYYPKRWILSASCNQ